MNMIFRTIAGNVGYVDFYKESSNLKIAITTKAIKPNAKLLLGPDLYSAAHGC